MQTLTIPLWVQVEGAMLLNSLRWNHRLWRLLDINVLALILTYLNGYHLLRHFLQSTSLIIVRFT